ncbi:MAG: AGE family epimerase/isomerase [Lachnospiraceae bacterium]
MRTFVKEIGRHLKEDLIPFWEGLKDEEYGGYYGWLGYDLKLDKESGKGCILNSRILWFFSNAYRLLGWENLRADAEHAYRFLKEHCLDAEYGGIYWSLTYDGQVQDDMKHTYNQAFAVYALSSYYEASEDPEALALARSLFRLIEERCRDEYGYLEAFDRKFRPADNEKLSENGVMAEKTMNTLLHLLEGYTELYRVAKDPEVGRRLRYLLDLFAEKVYNRELGRQEVFFDRNWRPLIDLYSYGHDIESAWLVDRALEVLGDSACTERIRPITREITKNIYERALEGDSMPNEAENGVVDTTRVWWVQAEAVVGFVNGWEKNPQRTEYLDAAERIWRYICENVIDKRNGSEWFWAVDKDGKPLEKPVVEPWKCPYHNGRMCMEVIRRSGDDT